MSNTKKAEILAIEYGAMNRATLPAMCFRVAAGAYAKPMGRGDALKSPTSATCNRLDDAIFAEKAGVAITTVRVHRKTWANVYANCPEFHGWMLPADRMTPETAEPAEITEAIMADHPVRVAFSKWHPKAVKERADAAKETAEPDAKAIATKALSDPKVASAIASQIANSPKMQKEIAAKIEAHKTAAPSGITQIVDPAEVADKLIQEIADRLEALYGLDFTMMNEKSRNNHAEELRHIAERASSLAEVSAFNLDAELEKLTEGK